MAILFDSVPNISCVLVHVREHWGPIFSKNGKKVKDGKNLKTTSQVFANVLFFMTNTSIITLRTTWQSQS